MFSKIPHVMLLPIISFGYRNTITAETCKFSKKKQTDTLPLQLRAFFFCSPSFIHLLTKLVLKKMQPTKRAERTTILHVLVHVFCEQNIKRFRLNIFTTNFNFQKRKIYICSSSPFSNCLCKSSKTLRCFTGCGRNYPGS